jgi:presenilin-like A22 family membrane protease
MQKPVSILSRFLSAIVGLLVGGVVGMLALYFLMLLVRSDFGLDNVRPGAILGGVVGFLLRLRFPDPFAWHRLPF